MALVGEYGELSSDDAGMPVEEAEPSNSIVELKSKLKINAAPSVSQELKVPLRSLSPFELAVVVRSASSFVFLLAFVLTSPSFRPRLSAWMSLAH